ncbi:MAG: CRISPR-associated endoribonuclease Cas6 [Bacteroidota bacterium]
MRFKLILEKTGVRDILPINYQYEFSSWIYKIIHYGNPEFAEWLHSKGYMTKNRQFKLFTFSNLFNFRYTQNNDRLILDSDQISIILSFYPDEIIEPFVVGLFKEQKFKIGDKTSAVDFIVKTIEKLDEPIFEDKMQFKLISPIHIIQLNPFNTNKIEHLNPFHKDFERLFISNLMEKFNAFHKTVDLNSVGFNLKLLSEPVKRLIRIKADRPEETKLTGYLFSFEINANKELTSIGYYAGFGKANSLGFGCTEILK